MNCLTDPGNCSRLYVLFQFHPHHLSAIFRTENHKNGLRSVLGDEVIDDLLSMYTEKDIVKALVDDDAELNIIVEEFKKISEIEAQIDVL